jgi:hypothetical protein
MGIDVLEVISLLLALAIPATIIFFCARAIKRHWVDKKWIGSGSQFVGRSVYSQWVDKDKERAIEEVTFLEEEMREENYQSGSDDPNK